MENINEENEKMVLKNLEKCWDRWESIADAIEPKIKLNMKEYYVKKPQQNVVLGTEGHNYKKDLKVVFRNAPQSLRDVEETIDFWV